MVFDLGNTQTTRNNQHSYLEKLVLFKTHNQEWLNSAVSQSIIDLNVVSLQDFEPYDRILYGIAQSDRRNDGRIRDRLLKRYQHTEKGGWWVSGIDLFTGEDSSWGQFKPDIPYRYREKIGKGFSCDRYKNKLIKYETPKNVPTELIALKVSFLDSWNIVKNQNEAVKNEWIKRIQENWTFDSEKRGNVRGRSIRTVDSNNRRCLSRSETTTTESRGTDGAYKPTGLSRTRMQFESQPLPNEFGGQRLDSQESTEAKFLRELQEACAGREYRKIDRLLQPIRNKFKYNPEQFRNTDSRGVERLSKIEDRGFWPWFIETPQIPLILTEGSKKAGAIICANYVGIALPGIYNGYRQPKDEWGNKVGTPRLIPQLELLAKGGREIIFCFDNDTKPETVQNVRTAIAKTGTLLQLQGASVSVITWSDLEKGVDDLIAARGIDYFKSLYQARTSLSNFKLKAALDISKYKPLLVNQRYLGDNLVPPEHARLIGLKSPKNTGKTEWLSRIVRRLLLKGKPCLIITHRIQLAKALCARFGVDHIEEVKNSETRGILGYGLCIDSLHPNSQAHFNPEDWSESVVILDEAEQVIWHLLDSSTCQSNRVEIIENFQKLLRTVVSSGGQIYLSDADLSAIALDYVNDSIGFPVSTWVAQNVYRSPIKRKLISYTGNDPRELIATLIKTIEQDRKVFVQTTGQKAKSKWGSTNLELVLKQRFPDRRILRIDRETVSEPGHPAMGCMANLDHILSSYDIVIASPIIETGVSIDIRGHFDSVWAIAQGVQTVDAVCQTIERLREDVPRHIWIKTTAKGNRIGNGSTSVKGLLKSQHKLTQANIMLLQQASVEDFDGLEVNFSPASFWSWGKRACVVNAGKNNYRDSILAKLVSEGYELEKPVELEDLDDTNIIKQKVVQVCQENYRSFCQKVSTAPTLSERELEQLDCQKAKTETERLAERKGNLNKRYGIEVTPELVEKDDSGWYSQLQLHYYLTVGNIYLEGRDRRSLLQMSKQGNGKVFKPDINNRQLSAPIKALKILSIEQFLEPEREFTASSLTDWLEMIIRFRHELKSLLGVSVNPEKDSAIAVAQRILKQLGLKLEFKCWRGDRSSKQRVYGGCNVDPDKRGEVFNNWLARESRHDRDTVLTLS